MPAEITTSLSAVLSAYRDVRLTVMRAFGRDDRCNCAICNEGMGGDLTADQRYANDRALRLLYRWLTPDQRQEFVGGAFTVRGSHGGLYRIECDSRIGNVVRVDHGINVARFCGGPEVYLPYYDYALAQKLALETDEVEFLKVANVIGRNF